MVIEENIYLSDYYGIMRDIYVHPNRTDIIFTAILNDDISFIFRRPGALDDADLKGLDDYIQTTEKLMGLPYNAKAVIKINAGIKQFIQDTLAGTISLPDKSYKFTGDAEYLSNLLADEANSFLWYDEEDVHMKELLPKKSTITVYTESGPQQALLSRWSEAHENEDTVQLSLDVDGKNFTATSERGFFFALQNLRIDLETKGIKLAILGCCRNIYPSPMMSSMGDGTLAYRLTPAQQALRKDVVNIFDPCEVDMIATVAEQNAFYESWLKGLRES